MTNREMLDKIVAKIQEKTKKKCVKFTLKEKKTGLLESKIGGAPYIPQGGAYPVSPDGKKLYLLIQLNFGELPRLENFPEKGILQIFIGASDLYGADFDDPQAQDEWRVLYYPDVESPMSGEEVRALMPDAPEEVFQLPFSEYGREFGLEASLEEMGITPECYDFDRLFEAHCRELLGEAFREKAWFDLPAELSDGLCQRLSGQGVRLGGYPGFTQYDVRKGRFEEYELLLQVDTVWNGSQEYLMWGDCGIANFFIHPEDLKKRDFSRVVYNWDCG